MVSIVEHGSTPSQKSQESGNSPQEEICQEQQPLDSKRLQKSAISQRSVDISINPGLTKKNLHLDLVNKSQDIEDFVLKSPVSPLTSSIRCGRIPHQQSLTAQMELVEDRKTLRDALYQGIFHRHRRTIFAFGSFLRMLRTRSSQYNTIRSSSEADDIDEVR